MRAINFNDGWYIRNGVADPFSAIFGQQCRLPELLTKREVQYETNREQVGNDGNPREIKGYSEFEREKMKHL